MFPVIINQIQSVFHFRYYNELLITRIDNNVSNDE